MTITINRTKSDQVGMAKLDVDTINNIDWDRLSKARVRQLHKLFSHVQSIKLSSYE